VRATRTRPRQGMSARQVDRVEREVRAMLRMVAIACPCSAPACIAKRRLKLALRRRLTRLLASIQRSERR
jgi:hypothetical protein